MHEQACLGAAPHIEKVDIEMGGLVRLGQLKSLADIVDAHIPAELEGVPFAFQGEGGDDRAFAEAAVLQDVRRRGKFVAPKAAGQVAHHAADRAQ